MKLNDIKTTSATCPKTDKELISLSMTFGDGSLALDRHCVVFERGRTAAECARAMHDFADYIEGKSLARAYEPS